MNLLLRNDGAKPACEVPDGLRELCADISREVIRHQPCDIYCFAADYLDALLITRENANIAVKVVQNVVMKSEQIAEILAMTGLELEEIAAAMPRLRSAFKEYLDALDAEKKACGCDADSEVADRSELALCSILRDTGASYQKAQSAAIKIQAAFRGHYERMQLCRARGEICWQRAAVTTLEILRRLGVTRGEAARAATLIQSVYRGYYTRRNLKLREDRRKEMGIVEPKEPMGMDAWLFTLLEITGLTLARAHEAARTIQSAYRIHQARLERRKLEELRSQSKPSNKQDELSSTSTELVSASKDSARKLFGVTESSEDDLEVKLKELRFQTTVVVSEIPQEEFGAAEATELEEEKSTGSAEHEGHREVDSAAGGRVAELDAASAQSNDRVREAVAGETGSEREMGSQSDGEHEF